MANGNQTEIYYRLARSIILINGSVDDDVDPDTGEPRRNMASKVAVGVEADPRPAGRCKLPARGSFWKDRHFELALAEDGRLVGSNGSVVGRGGAAVVAGVRVVAFLGTFALRLGGVPVAIGVDRGDTKAQSVEDAYAKEHEEDAKRRQEFRAAIRALQGQIASEASRVPEVEDPAGIVTKVGAIQTVLEAVRSEAALLEQQFDSWRAARFPARREEYSYALGTDELPRIDTAPDCLELDLTALPAALQASAASLGVVVVEVGDPQESAPDSAPENRQQQSGIWFRAARPVTLAVYERAPDTQGGIEQSSTFRRARLFAHWVVDSRSALGFLRYESGVFSKRAAGLAFGPGGALTSISSASSATVSAVASAAGDTGAAIKESVEQAPRVQREELEHVKAEVDSLRARLGSLHD